MKYFITLFSLLIIIVTQAQEKVKVVYSHQMEMESESFAPIGESKINDAEKTALLEALQEIHYYELITSPKAYTFKKIEKINNDLPKEGGLSISISSGDSFAYTNLENQTKSSMVNHFNQKYIVKSNLEQFDWKITREKMTLLNYEVRKAIHQDNKQLVTAWYAPKIAIKSGPSEYWGLPGLILKVEVEELNDSHIKYHYTAQNIEILDNETALEKPTEGKVVTQEELSELMEDQMKKFRAMHSQGVDTTD